jgi:putative acetyltransferase
MDEPAAVAYARGHLHPAFPMHIEVDDLTREPVIALLREHLADMHAVSPPGTVHALDLERLRGPDITFWTAWDDGALLGCGALKQLSARAGEVKSMRTPAALRRRGAGRVVIEHIVGVARSRGYDSLWLETGSTPPFAPAHALYRSVGFDVCGPFADYREDPHSVFMRLKLA